MKFPVQKLARLWQFAGVAVAAHAATRHAMIAGTAEWDAAASWTRMFIGVSVAIVLFWTGIYFEGRSASANPPR